MKYFAKQLVNKHELLRTRVDVGDNVADHYICLDHFLTTAGLEPRTIKVCIVYVCTCFVPNSSFHVR